MESKGLDIIFMSFFLKGSREMDYDLEGKWLRKFFVFICLIKEIFSWFCNEGKDKL